MILTFYYRFVDMIYSFVYCHLGIIISRKLLIRWNGIYSLYYLTNNGLVWYMKKIFIRLIPCTAGPRVVQWITLLPKLLLLLSGSLNAGELKHFPLDWDWLNLSRMLLSAALKSYRIQLPNLRSKWIQSLNEFPSKWGDKWSVVVPQQRKINDWLNKSLA